MVCSWKIYYVNFLRNNMAVSRAYQDKLMEGMKVAYSGTEGAFAHIATSKLFPTARKIAYGDFQSAYRAVECGECDVAVLPTENSYNGEVGQVTDLMFSGTLFINGILELEVTHDLLALPSARKEDIKTVISHPQALAQCGKFIAERGYAQMEFSNTALAAKEVARLCDPTVAAIASEEAAALYGLAVLERNINSQRSNTTRFAVFSRTRKEQRGKRGLHSVLLFTVRNEAGALARAIDIIGQHGFNMRKLSSRPMKELMWQYYFYVELEGNLDTDEGDKLLSALTPYCDRLKFLGNY